MTRPPLEFHSPADLTRIEKLEHELAAVREAFIVRGEGTLIGILAVERQLNTLRPEWAGQQYVTPNDEIRRQAAENIFNEP